MTKKKTTKPAAEDEVLDHMVQVLCTEEQKELFDSAARADGRATAAFFRREMIRVSREVLNRAERDESEERSITE